MPANRDIDDLKISNSNKKSARILIGTAKSLVGTVFQEDNRISSEEAI